MAAPGKPAIPIAVEIQKASLPEAADGAHLPYDTADDGGATGKASDAASGGQLIDGKGFLAHELAGSKEANDVTDSTPMIGKANAVTDEHHSQVMHNESGLILAGGEGLPGMSAPSQSGTENEAEAGGPKGIQDTGSRGT